jgi:hypothetical protein
MRVIKAALKCGVPLPADNRGPAERKWYPYSWSEFMMTPGCTLVKEFWIKMSCFGAIIHSHKP